MQELGPDWLLITSVINRQGNLLRVALSQTILVNVLGSELRNDLGVRRFMCFGTVHIDSHVVNR